MNYLIKYDDGYFYPAKKGAFFCTEMLLPVFPYERDYHNENTREVESEISSFRKIFLAPRFRSKERLRKVVDTFLIAQKAYKGHPIVEPILYCQQTNSGDFDFFECNYPLNNPNRVLWNAGGVWEIRFILKNLPKEWQYATGHFDNLFHTAMEAESSINSYIANASKSAYICK